MKFTAQRGKNYNLKLVESNYTNNGKKYFWLIDKKDGEYFADITVNITDPVKTLSHYNYIDWSFIELCFKNDIEAVKKTIVWKLKNTGFLKVCRILLFYFLTTRKNDLRRIEKSNG